MSVAKRIYRRDNRCSIKWKHNDMLLRLISVLCQILIVWRKKVITPKTIASLDSHLPGYTQVFIPSLNVCRYPWYVSVLPVSFYDFSGICPFSFWNVLYLQQVSLTFKQKKSILLTRLKKSFYIQRGVVRWQRVCLHPWSVKRKRRDTRGI